VRRPARLVTRGRNTPNRGTSGSSSQRPPRSWAASSARASVARATRQARTAHADPPARDEPLHIGTWVDVRLGGNAFILPTARGRRRSPFREIVSSRGRPLHRRRSDQAHTGCPFAASVSPSRAMSCPKRSAAAITSGSTSARNSLARRNSVRCVRLDGSPGQVNEPLPRSALDVWSPNVRSGRASDHRGVKRPHRRRRISGSRSSSSSRRSRCWTPTERSHSQESRRCLHTSARAGHCLRSESAFHHRPRTAERSAFLRVRCDAAGSGLTPARWGHHGGSCRRVRPRRRRRR
jgi:hypothetical protein